MLIEVNVVRTPDQKSEAVGRPNQICEKAKASERCQATTFFPIKLKTSTVLTHIKKIIISSETQSPLVQ